MDSNCFERASSCNLRSSYTNGSTYVIVQNIQRACIPPTAPLITDATYLRHSQEFVLAQAGFPGLSFAALEIGR